MDLPSNQPKWETVSVVTKIRMSQLWGPTIGKLGCMCGSTVNMWWCPMEVKREQAARGVQWPAWLTHLSGGLGGWRSEGEYTWCSEVSKVILEMMNDLEVNMRLTMELVSEFQDNQLLTWDFTLWKENRGDEDKPDSKILHSFYIKPVTAQTSEHATLAPPLYTLWKKLRHGTFSGTIWHSWRAKKM